MNLVLDIGNTQTKAGWFESGRLIRSQRLDASIRDGLISLLERYPVDMVLVSTVGKADRDAFKSAGIALNKMLFLDHHLPLPLKIDYATPETLGYDRIAAAAGAKCLYPGYPLLVMDLGTAITIDFVTSEGEFKGGNISPGLETRFKSLHDHTARLPLVKKDTEYPEFGYNTQSAIAAGVQQGIIYELNGYLNQFEEIYPHCKFVVTGGDTRFFVPKLKKTIFAHPDLVLTGLNHILEFNNPLIRQ
jgi:type III pantothenate kinase